MKPKITKREKIVCSFFVIFCCCCLLSCQGRKQELRVLFLDVGQGDSTVLETPSGKVCVIDTGNLSSDGKTDQGRRVVAPYLRWRGIQKIDLLILTHPDLDHLGGAKSLLSDFSVDMLIDNGQIGEREAGIVRQIREKADQKHTRYKYSTIE